MTANGPQRVVWSEGLLIGPQHLQQLDLYHERLLAMRLEAVESLHWGVVRVEFDVGALAAGHVKLQRLHAVMPDGAVLALEAGDPELPKLRHLEGQFPPGERVLEVFVGLPREREGLENYGEAHQAGARYRITRREVRDTTAPQRRSEVAFGQRNASLLLGSEPHSDHIVMKIAELGRDHAGQLIVLDSYVPPCLRVAASPFVLAGMRRLLETMTSRRRSLHEARRQAGRGALEWNAMDVTRYLLLSCINGAIPLLQHFVDPGDVSPRMAYCALSQLAGQLCSFVADADPTQLPAFAYRDLGGTFEALFARITALLLATVSEHFVAVPLTTREDGMYVAQLSDERLRSCDRFVLAVQTDVPERQVATQLPQFAKLAAWSEIQSIVRAATPGAPLEVNYRPPPEIPIKAGHVYFDISLQNPYWRKIVHERELALYLPPFFEPSRTNLILMAVPARTPDAPNGAANTP
jgi:type VI secretion system protein ImpJ